MNDDNDNGKRKRIGLRNTRETRLLAGVDCPKSGPGPPGPDTKGPGPGPDAADLDPES